jgi:hypothetical protein
MVALVGDEMRLGRSISQMAVVKVLNAVEEALLAEYCLTIPTTTRQHGCI